MCELYRVELMPQVFKASADIRLRVFALVVLLLLVGAGMFAAGIMNSSYLTLVGWVRPQPVPFSHKHHVSDLGIDCRFCHTSVDSGPHAGLPATQVCMTCHSQIWTGASVLAQVRQSFATNRPLEWQRVARLPDYVYFNHSIHIARGVPCVTCHGRVDRMPMLARAQPFQMRWCIACHRNPAPNLRPPAEVTRMDWSDWDNHPALHAGYGDQMVKVYGIHPATLDDCNICHR
jgi:hypothetical protein